MCEAVNTLAFCFLQDSHAPCSRVFLYALRSSAVIFRFVLGRMGCPVCELHTSCCELAFGIAREGPYLVLVLSLAGSDIAGECIDPEWERDV